MSRQPRLRQLPMFLDAGVARAVEALADREREIALELHRRPLDAAGRTWLDAIVARSAEGITLEALLARYGSARVRAARRAAWLAIRESAIASLEEIALALDVDAATLSAGLRRAAKVRAEEEAAQAAVAAYQASQASTEGRAA